MANLVASQRKQSSELIELWGKLYSKLETLGLPTKQLIPGPDLSLANTNLALLTRLEYLNSVRMLPTSSEHLIPENQARAVLSNLDAMKSALKTLRQKLSDLEAAGGFKSADANFSITARNGTTISFAELSQVWSSSTNALSAFLTLSPALGIGSTTTMASRAAVLQRLKSKADATLKAASDVLTAVQGSSGEVSSILETIKQAAEESSKENEKSKALASEAHQLAGVAREKTGEIEQIVTRANKLSEQVESHGSRFSAFDSQLDARIATLAEADKLTLSAEQQSIEREGEIDRLIQKSSDMIKGATVAGLASSFGDLAAIYERETRWSRFAFYFSIAVLFFSVLPLVAYLAPGPALIDRFGLPSGWAALMGAGEVTLPGVLGRLIVLLPGTWLAGFCSRRYRKLFQLKEAYAHKTALAQSIEGFKREAPSFQEEIAAAVFWDLTQKSEQASESRHDSGDVPNPIMRFILGRFENREE